MSILSSVMAYKGVILFYLFIVLIIYINRKKFDKQGPLMYLYKTTVGLKFMDRAGSKARSFVKILGLIGIAVAYIGFVIVGFSLFKNAFDIIINKPGAVGGSPVIPGLPIAGLGITFPLVIGWISLFIIMIVHEFSHGIMARAYNVKVKSSGIAFFGPIMGAFVEPDDKQLFKQPAKAQLSVFAAGPVSNVVLWVVCIGLMLGLSSLIASFSTPSGVMANPILNESLPAFASGFPEKSVITGINDNVITNYSSFTNALDSLSPGDSVSLITDKGTFDLIAGKNPENESKAYIGITGFEQKWLPKTRNFFNDFLLNFMLWFYELLTWTGFISINIGLINLFPIFITDGAQMFRNNTQNIFKKNKELGDRIWRTVNTLCLLVIGILLLFPLFRGIVLSVFGLFL